MEGKREFKDVVKSRDIEQALPVDQYLKQLDELIVATMAGVKDKLTPAIGAGTATREVVKRIALEYYYLGKWMTPEFPLLIATAPDTDALRLDASEHYQHWAQNFADESGYLGDPNHVDMKAEFCHQVSLCDEEILAYPPLPGTVGMVLTHTSYMLRSYPERRAAPHAIGDARAPLGDECVVSTGSNVEACRVNPHLVRPAVRMPEGLPGGRTLLAERFEWHALNAEEDGEEEGCLTAFVHASF